MRPKNCDPFGQRYLLQALDLDPKGLWLWGIMNLYNVTVITQLCATRVPIVFCLLEESFHVFFSQKSQMNSCALQDQARLQTYIKATKTIAITVVAYFMSYAPAIVYAVVGQREMSQVDSWFAFVAWNATFFSSVVNPIIYYLRTRRLRSAFKQFLKDPLGSSDFKDRPTGSGKKAGKRKPERAAAKTNGGEKANGIKYSGGNKIMAIEALPAHLRVPAEAAEESSLDGRRKLPKQDSFCSTGGALSCPVIASSYFPVIERRGDWKKRGKKTTVEKEMASEATGMATEFDEEEESGKSGLEAIPEEKRTSLSQGISTIV